MTYNKGEEARSLWNFDCDVLCLILPPSRAAEKAGVNVSKRRVSVLAWLVASESWREQPIQPTKSINYQNWNEHIRTL